MDGRANGPAKDLDGLIRHGPINKMLSNKCVSHDNRTSKFVSFENRSFCTRPRSRSILIRHKHTIFTYTTSHIFELGPCGGYCCERCLGREDFNRNRSMSAFLTAVVATHVSNTWMSTICPAGVLMVLKLIKKRQWTRIFH